jgi:hypothetical protein
MKSKRNVFDKKSTTSPTFALYPKSPHLKITSTSQPILILTHALVSPPRLQSYREKKEAGK